MSAKSRRPPEERACGVRCALGVRGGSPRWDAGSTRVSRTVPRERVRHHGAGGLRRRPCQVGLHEVRRPAEAGLASVLGACSRRAGRRSPRTGCTQDFARCRRGMPGVGQAEFRTRPRPPAGALMPPRPHAGPGTPEQEHRAVNSTRRERRSSTRPSPLAARRSGPRPLHRGPRPGLRPARADHPAAAAPAASPPPGCTAEVPRRAPVLDSSARRPGARVPARRNSP